MLKKAEAAEALEFIRVCRAEGATVVAITADGGVTVHFGAPARPVGAVTPQPQVPPHPERKPKQTKKDEPPADPRRARQNIRDQVVAAAKNGGF